MSKFTGYALGLALFAIVSLFAAASNLIHRLSWQETTAQVSGLISVCRFHSRRTGTDTFDCNDMVSAEKYQRAGWSQEETVGVRGTAKYEVSGGRSIETPFYDENFEASSLVEGQKVAIKYNGSNPREFELEAVLNDRPRTLGIFGLVGLIPIAILGCVFVLNKKYPNS